MDRDFDSDLSQEEASVFRRLTEYTRQNKTPLDDNSGMGGDEHLILPYDDNVVEEHDVSHDIVKRRLITHFKWANRNKEVFWATRNGSISRYNVASDR